MLHSSPPPPLLHRQNVGGKRMGALRASPAGGPHLPLFPFSFSSPPPFQPPGRNPVRLFVTNFFFPLLPPSSSPIAERLQESQKGKSAAEAPPFPSFSPFSFSPPKKKGGQRNLAPSILHLLLLFSSTLGGGGFGSGVTSQNLTALFSNFFPPPPPPSFFSFFSPLNPPRPMRRLDGKPSSLLIQIRRLGL